MLFSGCYIFLYTRIYIRVDDADTFENDVGLRLSCWEEWGVEQGYENCHSSRLCLSSMHMLTFEIPVSNRRKLSPWQNKLVNCPPAFILLITAKWNSKHTHKHARTQTQEIYNLHTSDLGMQKKKMFGIPKYLHKNHIDRIMTYLCVKMK